MNALPRKRHLPAHRGSSGLSLEEFHRLQHQPVPPETASSLFTDGVTALQFKGNSKFPLLWFLFTGKMLALALHLEIPSLLFWRHTDSWRERHALSVPQLPFLKRVSSHSCLLAGFVCSRSQKHLQPGRLLAVPGTGGPPLSGKQGQDKSLAQPSVSSSLGNSQ